MENKPTPNGEKGKQHGVKAKRSVMLVLYGKNYAKRAPLRMDASR